uniref:Replication factor C (activator 1) 4 n=1 Tax=Eptatretus burgeri TaxID=7764 RepID=A0A8C4QIA4_EPTBU
MQAFLRGGGKEPSSSETETSTSAGHKQRHVPWVEKYRPRTVDDVAHQDEVVAVLKNIIAGGDLPNLLFYGPPGTGKTSTILAAARDLFGSSLLSNRVLELNASDDRGIAVVRDRVKGFAQQALCGSRQDGRPTPPFKLIILDEADSMTQPAQAALRRTMERQARSTRFCLICNYISRIIEPLTSRCSKFRFRPLPEAAQHARLEEIANGEGLALAEGAISELVASAAGDLRRAVTLLQGANRLVGHNQLVTATLIRDIAGTVPEERITGVIDACKSNSYDKINKTLKGLLSDGYAASDIIVNINDLLVTHSQLTDKQKSVLAERLAEVDLALSDGSDDFLQILSFCMLFSRTLTTP